MNLLQYTNKSRAIDNKLGALLNQLKYDYNNGNIRTETEYYYRLKNMLSEFYKTLNKPSFKFRPAVNLPISEDYSSMLVEAYNDIEYIINDYNELSNLIEQSYFEANMSRDMLKNELEYVSKKISSISSNINKTKSNGDIIVSEEFNDMTKFGNAEATNSCRINTKYGMLTLRELMSVDEEIKQIEIDNETSNGFPGNTHCVNTLNKEIHFIGEENLRNNIYSILKNNKDHWFEFELFKIDDETRKKCNSFGFEYEEGVSWVNNEDYLKLKLNITVKGDNKSSCIIIKPYLSEIKGVKEPIIEKCEVITESNNICCIKENISFDKPLILSFEPNKIKKIEITIIQPYAYKTKIGHQYYTSYNQYNAFKEIDENDKITRVNGKNIPIGVIGCEYNPKTKWIDYNTNNKNISKEYIKNILFSEPESTIDKIGLMEIIDAYRYMIGISNIEIISSEFMEYGEYISKTINTKNVITSVSLESNEYIPSNSTEDIKYYISLNNGETWHNIYPMHRAYEGISKYYINTNSIENIISNKEKRTKNISIIGEPKSIKIKIEMKRPKDENSRNISPILYNYKLILKTGGETIEY